MHLLYELLLSLYLPAALGRLAFRGLRQPDYRRGWHQRLGWAPARASQGPCLWLHAASLGEVRAAAPLILRLLETHAQLPTLLSTVTPSGAELARRLVGPRLAQVLVPYDLSWCVNRYFDRVRPGLLVLLEAELWPNILRVARSRHVPTVLLNARISAGAERGYARFPRLVRPMLAGLTLVTARSQKDASRCISLGADPARVVVTGDLKLDCGPPPDGGREGRALRQAWGEGRPTVLAASTHVEEELHVLEAYARLRARVPDAVLILAPRHPGRSWTTAARAGARHRLHRRSEGLPPSGTQVYFVDTLGELSGLYSAADCVFVGGSLLPRGGHSPAEACAHGLPVLVGPHREEFDWLYAALLTGGGAREVRGPVDLAEAMCRWLQRAGERYEAGRAGRRVIERHRGALGRTEALLAPLLRAIGSTSAGRTPL